ncbi:MAG: hypothetical protein AB7V27_16635 [Candidatus Binatia bacterium]
MSDACPQSMTEAESAFAARAVRRKGVFRTLTGVNLAAAAVLAVFYAYQSFADPRFALAPHAVIVLLILLNARQNLRQYRYATILQKLMRGG